MKTPGLQVAAEEIAHRFGYGKPAYFGKGAFKETFKVTDTGGNCLALKIFDPIKFNSDRSNREIAAMMSCNHQYISKVLKYDSHIDGIGTKYHFMIEEFYDGGCLTDRIESLTHDGIRQISINIIEAIKHLKTVDLVHRDIKPDNLMFRSGDNNAILVDFGLVRNIGMESLTASWLPRGPGTPLYSSPEQLNNDKHMIDWRSDQFSLGVLLSILLTKRHPMQHSDVDIHEAIARVSNRSKVSDHIKDQLENSGFSYVVKMINPWPIGRFNCPNELLKAATM